MCCMEPSPPRLILPTAAGRRQATSTRALPGPPTHQPFGKVDIPPPGELCTFGYLGLTTSSRSKLGIRRLIGSGCGASSGHRPQPTAAPPPAPPSAPCARQPLRDRRTPFRTRRLDPPAPRPRPSRRAHLLRRRRLLAPPGRAHLYVPYILWASWTSNRARDAAALPQAPDSAAVRVRLQHRPHLNTGETTTLVPSNPQRVLHLLICALHVLGPTRRSGAISYEKLETSAVAIRGGGGLGRAAARAHRSSEFVEFLVRDRAPIGDSGIGEGGRIRATRSYGVQPMQRLKPLPGFPDSALFKQDSPGPSLCISGRTSGARGAVWTAPGRECEAHCSDHPWARAPDARKESSSQYSQRFPESPDSLQLSSYSSAGHRGRGSCTLGSCAPSRGSASHDHADEGTFDWNSAAPDVRFRPPLSPPEPFGTRVGVGVFLLANLVHPSAAFKPTSILSKTNTSTLSFDVPESQRRRLYFRGYASEILELSIPGKLDLEVGDLSGAGCGRIAHLRNAASICTRFDLVNPPAYERSSTSIDKGKVKSTQLLESEDDEGNIVAIQLSQMGRGTAWRRLRTEQGENPNGHRGKFRAIVPSQEGGRTFERNFNEQSSGVENIGAESRAGRTIVTGWGQVRRDTRRVLDQAGLRELQTYKARDARGVWNLSELRRSISAGYWAEDGVIAGGVGPGSRRRRSGLPNGLQGIKCWLQRVRRAWDRGSVAGWSRVEKAGARRSSDVELDRRRVLQRIKQWV
ncbi:hypothetical protein B0H17DRAFT_1232592 [Mycena rosella]|uniref:Uncharacterized protein n=1 Tax=Mycena rosella TaxID=1033263 RepID=A0AAD7D5E7_MYCRO|nr:hypothetical protein B0H17DRAFT_1232592 [Mycena rosella]